MSPRFAFVVAILMLVPSGYSDPPTTLCDLLRNPEKYAGKEVTVRATWRYGFEWSQFYCIDCAPKEMTWLEVSSELDDASNRALKRIPKGAGIVNITVEGTFQSGGHYGHLDGYPNQFIARKISNIAIVSKGMRPLAEEQEVEKHWACGGSNPK
jgi:hypothetical protein